MVSITILALGAASFIARAASMPLVFGIRMSIRTTFRKGRTRLRHRLGTVAGLADQLDVGLGAEDHLQPAPEERVIIGDQHTNRVGSFPADPFVAGGTGTLAHAVSSHLRSPRPQDRPGPPGRVPDTAARRHDGHVHRWWPSHGTLRKSGAPRMDRTASTRYPVSASATHPEPSINRITP